LCLAGPPPLSTPGPTHAAPPRSAQHAPLAVPGGETPTRHGVAGVNGHAPGGDGGQGRRSAAPARARAERPAQGRSRPPRRKHTAHRRVGEGRLAASRSSSNKNDTGCLIVPKLPDSVRFWSNAPHRRPPGTAPGQMAFGGVDTARRRLKAVFRLRPCQKAHGGQESRPRNGISPPTPSRAAALAGQRKHASPRHRSRTPKLRTP